MIDFKKLFSSKKNKDSIIQVKTTATAINESKKKIAKLSFYAVAIIVFLAIAVQLLSGKKIAREKPVEYKQFEMTPAGVDKQSFETRTQADIASLKNKIKAIEKSIKSADEKTDDIKKIISENKDSANKNFEAINKALMTLIESQQAAEKNAGLAKGKQEKTMTFNGNAQILPPPDKADAGALPDKPDSPALPPPPRAKTSTSVASGTDDGQDKNNTTADKNDYIILGPEASEDDVVNVNVTRTENAFAGYLSPGYVSAVNLSGVSAGTSSTNQSNPSPILMRVQGDAQLAGSAQYKLKGCFVLGNAFGDIRTQRVKIDVASLSCVDTNNRLVLEETLTGFILDSDGEEGVRGELIEQRGTVLFKATLASIVEGLGSAFEEAQGTTFDTAFGQGASINGADAIKSSVFSGASKGASLLSEFYLKEAEQLFPVIRILPNRKINIVVTKGKALKWQDYGNLFIEKITPDNSGE